MIQDVVVSVGG